MLHQIIFANIDGDMAVIQGTNKKDVLTDAYCRYLELPVEEDVMNEWGIEKYSPTVFNDILTKGGYLELPYAPPYGGYVNTFIRYNTWEETE